MLLLTGLHGHSSVRQVALSTGQVLQRQTLDKRSFGEGLTRLNDTIYQILWQTGRGYKFNATDKLQPVSEDGCW